MKRVLKYGTGDEIPQGAQYLSTFVEKFSITGADEKTATSSTTEKNMFVWHYFLVECDEKGKPI